MPILYFTFGKSLPAGNPFDLNEFLRQISIPRAFISGFIGIFAIGIYNYCGLSLTRKVNSTSRTTIDVTKTALIWILSMALGWESFKWLQVLGFATLICGSLIFNNVITF